MFWSVGVDVDEVVLKKTTHIVVALCGLYIAFILT